MSRDPGRMRSEFVERLRAVARAASCAGNPADALALGRLYGTLGYINDAGIYADDHLVRAFAERFPAAEPQGAARNGGVVHVITNAYRSGGHTRLMERLAAAHTPPAGLVVTRSSEVDFLRERKGLFATVRDLSRAPEVARVEQLTQELVRHRTVVLHTSEDDFIATVAAWRARQRGSAVLFMNHADHHFSFGREIAHAILQIGAYGQALTAEHLPNARSFHVGIPLPGARREPGSPPARRGPIRVMSAGDSWKFRPELGLSLPAVLGDVLAARPDLSVSIIGVRPLRDRWWWRLKVRHRERVRLSGLMPYEEYMRALAAAQVLLDSFPITGGTAFPEAVWSGKFACALRSPFGGWSPADTLRVPGARELLELLEHPDEYRARLVECQSLLDEAHGMAAVHRRYLSALEGRGALSDPRGGIDSGFLCRAWEARGHFRIPALSNVDSARSRAVLTEVFPPYARRLTGAGRFRSFVSVLHRIRDGG